MGSGRAGLSDALAKDLASLIFMLASGALTSAPTRGVLVPLL